jgi:NTP pyrophosphatase (non-canonical NTP hydrolase)
MEMNQYLQESKCTDLPDITPAHQRITPEMTQLLHGAIGISTEAGEILDAFKKSIYYGKPLDKVNVMEEVGDVMWYCALILREIGYSFEDVAQININKLRARFGDKFSEFDAQNRDLARERSILEAKNDPIIQVDL